MLVSMLVILKPMLVLVLRVVLVIRRLLLLLLRYSIVATTNVRTYVRTVHSSIKHRASSIGYRIEYRVSSIDTEAQTQTHRER